MQEWQPEIELLRACARRDLTTADHSRARTAINRGLDWQKAIGLANVHGLLPLLRRHASDPDLAVPPDARASLQQRARASAARALRLSGELASLLTRCDAQHIPLLPLKGPVLAQQVYDSVALRQVRDLDVLCHERHVADVVTILRERGYRAEDDVPAPLRDLARDTSHHVSFVSPAGVKVELHYCLLRPRGRERWPMARLEPYLRRATFANHEIRVLAGEELLVYLCEHGAEHAWSRLEWLAAVAQLLRDGHVRDWTKVEAFATDLAAVDRVRAGVQLADELFGAGDAAAMLPRRPLTFLANRIVHRRLQHDPGRIAGTPFEHAGYLLGTDATISARLRRLRTVLFAPSLADRPLRPTTPMHRLAPAMYRPLRLVARQCRTWMALLHPRRVDTRGGPL